MANIAGFTRAVQDKYGVRPQVPFGSSIEIGDIGRIGSDGKWQPVSTTRKRFGCSPERIKKQPDSRGSWDATSGTNVVFRVYGDGDVSKLFPQVANAKARTEISFKSSDSFVFAAKGVTVTTATDVDEVVAAVRHAYHRRNTLPESKRWDQDLAFVFAVADAKTMTALLAEESDTDVALSGKGTVGPPLSAADIALGVDIGVSTKQLQKVRQSPAPRAFYRAYKLQPSVFRRWDKEKVEIAGRLAGAVAQPVGKATGRTARKLDELPLPSFEETFKPV